MKVLWFSNSSANGDEYLNTQLKGTGGWLKALDSALQEKVDLHVAFYNDTDSSFKYGNTQYYPIYKNNSLFTRFIDTKFSRILVREDINKYTDIINRVKPDIIHIHGTENSFGCILEQTNIPVVISIQGYIKVIHHKYFRGIEKKYLNETEGIKYWLLGFKKFKLYYKNFQLMMNRERDTLLLCENIIGRTNWDRRVGSVLSPNSSYFHNDEILRNGFYKSKWQNNPSDKLILFTTNGNSFYKGLETLCHSISILIESGFTNFEWRVAGISNNDLIVKIVRKKLKSLFPKSNLVFLGKLHEHDLIENLMQANLYVMSSHIENSPNSLCEAMILGIPSIATYAGGTSSLLEDGVEGMLIQDGDPWSMVGAILEYQKNPDKFIEFGINARVKSLKRHDKNTIANDLVSIYNEIIKNTKI